MRSACESFRESPWRLMYDSTVNHMRAGGRDRGRCDALSAVKRSWIACGPEADAGNARFTLCLLASTL